MKIEDVSIDSELAEFLPPLSDEEVGLLRQSIQKDGFIDPVVVWLNRGVVVDGHNRLSIWRELGSDPDNSPDLVEKKFDDKAAVMQWMLDRQGGRRNLTAAQKAEAALKMKPSLAERARENMVSGGGDQKSRNRVKKSGLPNSANPKNTREELAKIAGVGHDTISKVETVVKHGSEETKKAMRAGKISANAAYKQTVSEPRFSKNFNPEEFDPEITRKKPKNGRIVKFKEELINKSMRQLVQAISKRREEIKTGEQGYQQVRSAMDLLAKGLENWRSEK